jgi:uncharacterized protein YkwD
MSLQNRPWHFGSDGSSPMVRVQRVGYTGRLVGENISETYQTELETLSAWMAQPDTRAIIMEPQARELGFAWFQEPKTARSGGRWSPAPEVPAPKPFRSQRNRKGAPAAPF